MNKINKIAIIILVILIICTTISFADTGVVNTEEIRLRKEASTEAETLLYLIKNDEVEIIEKSGDWYKVKYKENEGYVRGDLLNIKTVEATTTEEVNETADLTNTENTNSTNNTTAEVANTTTTTATEIVYPIESVTKVLTKLYILPLISSSSLTNIEQGKTITVKKVLNNWSYVSYENISGWVRSSLLNANATSVVNTTGYINVDSVNLRQTASTSANILTTLTRNTQVTILIQENDWYKVNYGTFEGYISKPLVSTQVTTTTRNQEESRTANITIENSISKGEEIASYAKQYLGYNYVWGGKLPETGFDDTGFTQYVYSIFGHNIGGCSSQIAYGTSVERKNLQVGDLIGFNNGDNGSIGHVGIYIGNGQFIHASNPTRGVVIDTINSGYYDTYYALARRII